MVKVKANKKSGPISTEEQNFISLNSKTLSPQEIADKLGRNVDTIIKQMGQVNTLSVKGTILDLEKREDWKMIRSQFSDEELDLFRDRWFGLVQQFHDELQYSEAMTVMLAIKQDILSNRILNDERKIVLEIARLEDERQNELKQDPPDKARIENIEFQISSYCAAQSANNKAYIESVDKLEKTIKMLKGSREQRLTKVEESKKSFSVFMRRLIEDSDLKRKLGQDMQKMKVGMEIELKRLAAYHKYANDTLDRPFLSADTVDMETQEDENNE